MTIQKNTAQAQITGKNRLSAMIPGCLLLAGAWGMLLHSWQMSMPWLLLLLPAVGALALGLLFRWEKKWQAVTAVCLLAAACVAGILLRRQLAADLAALLENMNTWRFFATGHYTPAFENAGDGTVLLCLISATSGIVTAALLRRKQPLVQVLLAAAALLGWMTGWLSGGWWLALYLAGTLLTVAACASGQGKALHFSGLIALVLAAVIGASVLLTGVAPKKTGLGSSLEKAWHRVCWEETENPLPEGLLTDLDAFDPDSKPALEVTMEQWTPLYLRGFVAGSYTDSGWTPLETSNLGEQAEQLYTLQREYFLPATQLYTAAQAASTEIGNAVTVKNLGACDAYAYLPYGAGDVSAEVLDPADLLREGIHAPKAAQYSTALYDITGSYLLQARLKDMTDDPYRLAEGTYRDFVYENYLTVPQDAYDTLMTYFTVDGQITTVQAKREITRLLDELLSYDENILTHTGEKDFLSYVLEVSRSGYSVHYATLATLLLRCCGIPARYVEGYVVMPGQAEALTGGETLTLTQANAHAWTEYYLDGIGWLPFDATPGYTDILTYALPTEGRPTGEQTGGIQLQEQPREQPEKKPHVEEEETGLDPRRLIRQAGGMLLVLLVLALLALILRTALLRAGLRRKRRRFGSGDARLACAAMACYMQTLTKAMGKTWDARSVPQTAKAMADCLDGSVPEGALAAFLDEIWYSGHPIHRETAEQAAAWLAALGTAWKKKVPVHKRFWQRFITCKVM